ncbi:MAG: HD domain-containing protein [Burkholderiales bacterium]|nr:HD domain-containing protein [Burkholderiales bacterium]
MEARLPAGSDDPTVVGSNAWAALGGPPLSLGQKVGYLLSANLAYLEELPGEIRWILSSRGLFPAAEVASVGVQGLPETAAVELAIKQLERYAEGEREIVNHSYRTFHFADLLHRQESDAMPMDREVLAVAMLLHDVGIFPRAVAELPGNDFTVRGANLARHILEQAGWSPYRIDLAAQAITINPRPRVPRHWGAEAYFGRLAPLVDVVGQCWKLDAGDAREVFARHPADGIVPAILGAVATEAKRHPHSRFALLKPIFPFLLMNCECRWHRRLGTATGPRGG